MRTAGTMTERTSWQWQARPIRTRRYAMIVAAIVFGVHVFLAVTLREAASTGVYFRPVDQVAMVCIGGAIAGAILLLARARIRVGTDGVGVRNAFVERFIPWSDVRGLTFAEGASWARIELPDDEYVPVLAIQANDGEHAAESAEAFRAYEDRYVPR